MSFLNSLVGRHLKPHQVCHIKQALSTLLAQPCTKCIIEGSLNKNSTIFKVIYFRPTPKKAEYAWVSYTEIKIGACLYIRDVDENIDETCYGSTSRNKTHNVYNTLN